jgi:hypothetical protein
VPLVNRTGRPARNALGFATRVQADPSILNGQAVYAIWDTTALKIGTCRGPPQERLLELATGNPRPLALLAYHMGLTEAEAHRKLRKHRQRGEWFALAPSVLDEVAGWDWLDQTLFTELRRTTEEP